MRNLATGDIVKLGALSLGGVIQTLPIRPWYNGHTPPGAPGHGDILSHFPGQTIDIVNTPTNDAQKIRWVEVNYIGKKYLISNRVLVVNISWDELNKQGLIFGKNIMIDGILCKLRVLTAGSTYRGSYIFEGGSPATNEWDSFITNELSLSGLPKPSATDLDTITDETDLNSVHNRFWNWYYAYSWGQETSTTHTGKRAVRGHYTARTWNYASVTTRNPGIGWRPVLEILDSAPVISGPSENQGTKTGPFSIVYSCADVDFDTFSVVEKVNGQTVGNLTGLSNLNDREIAIDLTTWNALALNASHTITVEATDVNGNKTTKEWTFVKTNSQPTAEIVEPKGDALTQAIVDSTTPVFVHRFTDPDTSDAQTAYQYIIENVATEEVAHDTEKVMSTQTFLSVPQSKLNWGERYKFKMRVWDRFDVPSEYTEYQFFIPNRPPTATNLAPGSNSKETPEGTGSEPTFTWAFTDLDLEAQGSYQLKIYKTQDDMLVYNSNRIYKNIQTHTIPQGVLENGYDYYAVLKVWDVNNLSAVTPEAYFRTNATPTTPTQTLPIDNCRTTLRPTFQAIIGRDNEDDGMHFAIQVSKDENFSNEVLEYNSKMQRNGWKVNGSDIDTIGATNSSEGQIVSYEMQVDLDRNSTYFWRICGVDANTGAKGAWSSARRVRIGNVLEFELKSPIDTQSVAARRILIAMEYALPQDGNTKAEMKLEVCNNAFDSIPTWENATEKFLKTDYYEFVNYSKTAENYGISIRVTINSNDSMKEIAVYSLGVTFD